MHQHARRENTVLEVASVDGKASGIPVRALDVLDVVIIIGTICAITIIVLAVMVCCKIHAYRSRTGNERRARRRARRKEVPFAKDELDPEELAEEGEIREKDGFPTRTRQGFAELGPDGQIEEIDGYPRGVASMDIGEIDGRMRLELDYREIYEMDSGDGMSLSCRSSCSEKPLKPGES